MGTTGANFPYLPAPKCRQVLDTGVQNSELNVELPQGFGVAINGSLQSVIIN